MIFTSRSQYITTDECWRRRWLAYEAPNGTEVNGWQRRAHAIPLATGQYVHRGLAAILRGGAILNAAWDAADQYRTDVTGRGLDTFGDVTSVIEEQATLIAGLVHAWGLVRWPLIANEWEVISVEREGAVPLADDVTHQYRCDWIGRRRADGKLFVWEFKTVSMVDERWLKSWEIDPQPLLNAWAVERELGKPVSGVIIEGLVKGMRRKDKDEFGNVIGERQQSLLCYGYHHPGNPPLTPEEWSPEYKRGRGWQRFAVGAPGMPAIEEWINELPRETLESLFVTVPPIYRDDERVFHKITQLVNRERDIALRTLECRIDGDLDAHFPQNERACLWPTRCPFFDACHTPNVGADMAGSGLYMPRQANHPVVVETE